MVGRAIATKLVRLGHDVVMGSRAATSEAAAEWVASTDGRGAQGTFAEAAAHGEIVFNCTAGAGSLEALGQAGAENLAGKTLIDVSNPLDFSQGMPPSLFVASTDSLGEQIQRTFPDARVVKALNMVNNEVMVDPARLQGDHDLFVAGNHEGAKAEARGLLESFGWPPGSIRDLGDLTAARGMEAYLLLWLRLLGTFGTGYLNIKIVT
jgi:predicted dinucleotide-binding enzyme